METSGLEPPKPIRPLTDEPVCAFDSDCVIYGYKGTEAERYADELGLTFVPADEVKTDQEGNKYYEAADGNLLYWVYPDHAVVRSNYEVTAGGARILKASGDVIIPSKINGVPVTGVFGFSGAPELTSVTLPDMVTTIAANAFYGCTSLKTINIPESVTFIGEEAFIETPWLENQRKESPLVIVNDILIDGQKCEGNVVIPNNVTNIADHAFMNCENIKSVSIPDSVSYIGREAFLGTAWLVSITDENGLAIANGFLLDGKKSKGDVVIPNTVKVITGHAFSEPVLSELTSVTIPKSVKTIEGYAFYNCPKLTSITILDPDCEIKGISAFDRAADYDSEVTAFDGTVYGYDGSTAQAYAKKHGYKFKSLGEAPNEENMVIPAEKDGKAVESVSIKDNPDVKTVTIPETVKSIKVENCPNITSFVVDGNNPYLCSIDGVVYNKNITVLLCYPANKPETSFETPVSVTEIASFAFDRSHNLEHLSLPGVVKIDERALANADISSVSFSENLTDIGNMGFAYNKALTRVVLPSSLKRAIYPFNECTSLSEIVILHKGINEEPWAATIDPELDSYSTLLGGCKNVTVYIPDEDYGFYKKEYEGGFWDTSCVLLKLSEYDGITTPGDANCDGNVNIADAVLVMQVATNPDKYAQGKSEYSITPQGEINADVDGKPGLSNSDAILIQKFKLGLIKEF
jgi:hypothetical protein